MGGVAGTDGVRGGDGGGKRGTAKGEREKEGRGGRRRG